MHRVASHVAHSARSEIPPAAPDPRMVGRMVSPEGSRANPQIPIEPVRHGWRVGRPDLTRGIDRMWRPHVHFPDWPDDTGKQNLRRAERLITGAALHAHLRGDLCFARCLCNDFGFVDGM